MRRTYLVVTGIVLLAGDAAGQTLDDKLCVLTAAQKLPVIQGLSVLANRVRMSTSAEAAGLLAGTRNDNTAGLAQSFSDLGLTDRRTLDLVNRALDRGERDPAIRALEAGLAAGVVNTRSVEFDVTLGSLQATYSFVCATARDKVVREDTLYVHSVGMIR